MRTLLGRCMLSHLLLVSVCTTAGFNLGSAVQFTKIASSRNAALTVLQTSGPKGYFSTNDVILVERRDEDVAAFHEKERTRWREVYDEEYAEAPQDFYPGDRVQIVSAVKVKEIEDASGMMGVVTHYEFDDGYESCQTCSTSCPVTVMLDETG